MTPQERQLVDDLFDRLSKMESAPRDPDAVSAIVQGLRRAPNAVYTLIQTVLVQDEALKRANDRIQQLEAAEAPEQNRSGGFLDAMRDTIFGQGQPRGSVPDTRPPEAPNRPTWNSGQVLQQPQGSGQYHQEPYGAPYGAPQGPMGGGGGSFLGTAAAAAAGALGGSLLLDGVRSMMGGGHHAFGNMAAGQNATGNTSQNPWSDQSGSGMARDAGINDIGSSANRDDDRSRPGLFDSASNDADQDQDQDQDDMDFGSDDFGGDSDYA